MMEYILKMKTVSNNLAAVGEPVKETDKILQLLRGLGSKYNAIVSLLTTRNEELSLHSVHSMLLTHDQWLTSQNTSSSDLNYVVAHMEIQTQPHHSFGFSDAKRG